MTQSLFRSSATPVDPLRVLFVSHSTRLFGAQRQLIDLVVGTRALGIVPLVGVPGDGPLTDALARLGVATLRVPDHRWSGVGLGFARRYVRAHLAAVDFAPSLARLGVDLVHSNTTSAAFSALAARRVGLPHVWQFHGLKHRWLHPRAELVRATVRRTVDATTRRVVVPSRDFAGRIVPYVSESLIQVVPNGLLSPEERRPLALTERRGGLRILTVGRNKEWNVAIECLAELLRRGYDARWTFVGAADPGPLRNLAASRGVAERIRFVGYVDDPTRYYLEADVHVLPSSYESFGRVLVEAMAVGCPVVAHRAGGISDVVLADETGALVEVGDLKGMVDAISRVVDDPAHTERMRQAAWRDVWSRFTIDRFARSFREIYQDCVA